MDVVPGFMRSYCRPVPGLQGANVDRGGGAMWGDSATYERFAAGTGVAVFAGCFGEYGYEVRAACEGEFRGCLR